MSSLPDPDPAGGQASCASDRGAMLDSSGLQRRVLLTGLLTLVAFVTVGVLLTAGNQPAWLLLPAMVIVYAVLVRPLMRPVHASNRLRRDLAYTAFLQGRDGRAGDDGG